MFVRRSERRHPGEGFQRPLQLATIRHWVSLQPPTQHQCERIECVNIVIGGDPGELIVHSGGDALRFFAPNTSLGYLILMGQ